MEQVSLRVTHDDLGLLLEQGPYAFVRGINMQMSLIGRERRVALPARKGRAATTQRIAVAEQDRRVVAGNEAVNSAARVLSSLKHRLKAGSGVREHQRWFRGDVAGAEAAIKKILSTARRTALVVDTYFAARDVKVWLPAIANRGAEVRILTSSFGLQQQSLIGTALKGRDLEREQLRRLSSEIDSAERDQLLNPTTVRVMPGAHAPIHDRFVVADDRVWLLGASLNEFGTRGTMLVALPLPAEVLPELSRVWEESVPIAERLSALEASAEDMGA